MKQGGLILAGGVRSKKKIHEIPPHPKQHEIHSSPASAITSRRRATKHIPRVSPYSPAFIDPEFMKIGLVHQHELQKVTFRLWGYTQISSYITKH